MLNSIGAALVAGIDNCDKIDMTQRSDCVCVAASNKANADDGNAKVLRHFASFRRIRKALDPMFATGPHRPICSRPYWGFCDSAIMYDIFIFTIHQFGLLMTLKNDR
ncbi:hypothetical protein RKLH11_1978 [Rhodobacteraceae bacterium KLH11]|nr:hypothetical protein RKLH11_1978 [Rhodobacteraceae bacterium KLH11]